MALTTKKRDEMEKLIYSVFNALDKTGKNTAKYKEQLSRMDDKQFDTWCKKFFKDDNENFYLEVTTFDDEINIKDIKKAADIIKVPLFEYVYMPFITNSKSSPIRSRVKVLVGYTHVKKLQQMVKKKNTMSTNITSRSPKTGMLTYDDKNSVSSDVENIALVNVGATETLKEFLGPRADDMEMKAEMLKGIARDGYVSMDSLPKNLDNKVALNTLDAFFIAAGLKTDLITDGLVLKRTQKDLNKGVDTISSKYVKN